MVLDFLKIFGRNFWNRFRMSNTHTRANLVSDRTSALYTASIFGWMLTATGVTAAISQWVLGVTDQPWQFLLLANLLMLFVGCFLEPTAAITILVPILVPICQQLRGSPPPQASPAMPSPTTQSVTPTTRIRVAGDFICGDETAGPSGGPPAPCHSQGLTQCEYPNISLK